MELSALHYFLITALSALLEAGGSLVYFAVTRNSLKNSLWVLLVNLITTPVALQLILYLEPFSFGIGIASTFILVAEITALAILLRKTYKPLETGLMVLMLNIFSIMVGAVLWVIVTGSLRI